MGHPMVTVKPKRVFTKQNHRKICFRKKVSYITGDFNINYLKYHENSKTKHFYESIFEKRAIPIITGLTRISEHLASLTDN